MVVLQKSPSSFCSPVTSAASVLILRRPSRPMRRPVGLLCGAMVTRRLLASKTSEFHQINDACRRPPCVFSTYDQICCIAAVALMHDHVPPPACLHPLPQRFSTGWSQLCREFVLAKTFFKYFKGCRFILVLRKFKSPVCNNPECLVYALDPSSTEGAVGDLTAKVQ